MAGIPGTVGLTGIIAPKDELDTYAVQEDKYGKGGYRAVSTIAERDAITPLRRKEGMMVYITTGNVIYVLIGGIDNANWVLHTNGNLTDLNDVDATTLNDGALLVYNDSTNKFVTTTTLDNANQTMVGGTF
jgi:hypothetical protein